MSHSISSVRARSLNAHDSPVVAEKGRPGESSFAGELLDSAVPQLT